LITRRIADQQFDLFVPYISDLPLRDQRETMERPFFSLASFMRRHDAETVTPDGRSQSADRNSEPS
jgi:hypothetical protein